MKTRNTMIAFMVAATLAAPSLLFASEKENRGQLSSSDYKFASAAARGGLMEVQAGEIAKTQGVDPQVKQFGEQMVTDHNKMNADLKTLVAQKGAVLPAEVTSKENREIQHLQKLTGTEFDRAYVKRMVEDHEKDLKEFQKASESATDSDLKAFATKNVSVISQHLDHARQLQAGMKSASR